MIALKSMFTVLVMVVSFWFISFWLVGNWVFNVCCSYFCCSNWRGVMGILKFWNMGFYYSFVVFFKSATEATDLLSSFRVPTDLLSSFFLTKGGFIFLLPTAGTSSSSSKMLLGLKSFLFMLGLVSLACYLGYKLLSLLG